MSLLLWRKNFPSEGITNEPALAYLLLQIAFLAGLSLLGRLVNGLVTWLMEETIYRRVYWQKRLKPQ